MRHRGWLVATLLLVSACGSSAPTYHGHEASTEGVPGFAYGKKLHPNVKLGKPYTVSGKTYVPHYQPEYTEEGLASWYGPGFHGGRTANGESFSTHDMTAAHPTLPLPSVVRVTHLGNGKQVYVRVNDRGPFAKGRIIDLSREAASRIGLIQDGVAKVRVDYMPAETQRFVELLTQGRSPQSIDLAGEVIGKGTFYAQAVPVTPVNTMVVAHTAPPQEESSWWDMFNPIASAQAEELPPAALPSSSSPIIVGPAIVAAEAPQPVAGESVVMVPVNEMTVHTSPPPTVSHMVPQPAPGTYIQLGAFSLESNAKSVQATTRDLGTTYIMPRQMGDATLYRVRMGPFISDGAAQEMLARVNQMGIAGAVIVHE